MTTAAELPELHGIKSIRNTILSMGCDLLYCWFFGELGSHSGAATENKLHMLNEAHI